MIKDVDTGTNLVCEDSRPNIRNGTPSQLIFHSHESDNREIERNIPVGKKKKRLMKPVLFIFTVGLDGHMTILRFGHVPGYIWAKFSGIWNLLGHSSKALHLIATTQVVLVTVLRSSAHIHARTEDAFRGSVSCSRTPRCENCSTMTF